MAAPSILFVSIPLSGHLMPAVSVAAATQRRLLAAGAGGAVRFASLSDARARVEAAGVDFVDLGAPSPEDAAAIEAHSPVRGGHKVDGDTMGVFHAYECAMFGPLLDAIKTGPARGTTAIVADFSTLAAHDLAEHLGLPLVLLHQIPLNWALLFVGRAGYTMGSNIPLEAVGPLLQSENLTPLQKALNPLLKRVVSRRFCASVLPLRHAARARLGLPHSPRLWPIGATPGAVPTCHIVSGSMELEVDRKLPPGWYMSGPQNVAFAGGRFPVPLPEGNANLSLFLDQAAEDGAPVVYIATGTIAEPSQAQINATAGAIALNPAARFIWALPKSCHYMLPLSVAEAVTTGRLRVLSFAPQQAILSHEAVRLFVTHGGLNSMYEGLAAGVPLLVTPYFGDQPVNAQHVVNKGLGDKVDPQTMTAADLGRRIARLLGDEATQSRAAEVGEALRAKSGAETAAERVEEFAWRAGGRGRRECAVKA